MEDIIKNLPVDFKVAGAQPAKEKYLVVEYSGQKHLVGRNRDGALDDLLAATGCGIASVQTYKKTPTIHIYASRSDYFEPLI